LPPVLANGVRRAGEPFFIMAQLRQRFCREEFGAVSRRVTEGLEQAGRNENGNFVCLKTEKPGRLKRTQPGWRNLPA